MRRESLIPGGGSHEGPFPIHDATSQMVVSPSIRFCHTFYSTEDPRWMSPLSRMKSLGYGAYFEGTRMSEWMPSNWAGDQHHLEKDPCKHSTKFTSIPLPLYPGLPREFLTRPILSPDRTRGLPCLLGEGRCPRCGYRNMTV